MSLDLVHTVVLDEADEMLNMGFTESIDDILSRFQTDVVCCYFRQLCLKKL